MSRTFALIQPTPDLHDLAAAGGQEALTAVQARGIAELERVVGEPIPVGCAITVTIMQTPMWDEQGAYVGEQHGVRYQVTLP